MKNVKLLQLKLNFVTKLIWKLCSVHFKKVAIQCRYKNAEGGFSDCIDRTAETSQDPFLTLSKEECTMLGKVPATISYRMCNDNDIVFSSPIKGETAIRFREENIISPPTWEDDIPANECRSYILKESIDLCKSTRVIDIEMEGRIAKSGRNYCRCYLYKESNLKITESPSASPSHTPSSNPSSEPTSVPTPSPTVVPSTTPSLTPSANPTFIPSNTPSDEPTSGPSLVPTNVPTTVPSTKPSNTPVVECKNDALFRFLNDQGYHRSCDWLKGDETKQHIYCDQKNKDGIVIGEACVESCNNCPCKDDESFTFVDDIGDRRTCAWLKGNEHLKHEYCSRECNGYTFIGNACVESCDWCPTSTPTAAPIQPAPVPTPTTGATCADTKDFTFMNDHGVGMSCDWLKGNKLLQDTYCPRECQGYFEFIGNACPESCNWCHPNSCEDDVSFTFVNDYGVSTSCDWLDGNAYLQHKYCARECGNGYDFIGNACLKSCNWCPVERKI